MTEEEINKRILICEERRNAYLEIGNTRIADKYSNEIYKWEKLLSKLDPKRDEQLRDYKKGYECLQQKINNAKQRLEYYLIGNMNYKDSQKELKKIWKELGGNENNN